MNQTARTCSMEGCHTITTHESKLCDQCREQVFDKINGIGRIPVDTKKQLLNAIWNLLPVPMQSKHEGKKETSFGLKTKEEMRECMEILYAKFQENETD